MDRFEASAWTLAGGGLSVFALAVVLKHAPWQVVYALLMIIVVLWALRAPVLAGGVLGLIAWACHTGFDVEKSGELVFAGSADVIRVFVLVGAGLIGAGLGALRTGREPARVWVPRPRGATGTARAVPGRTAPTKEARHV